MPCPDPRPVRAALFAAACLVLAGCAGADYVLQNYSGVKMETYAVPPANGERYVKKGEVIVDTARMYRIFDKPEENRLMITASLGDAAAQGYVQGATYGAVSGAQPKILYQNAAIGYLRSKGRDCRALDTYLLIEPQYEVKYECGPKPQAE